MTETGQAEWALGGYDDPAKADLVEMTRAQLADPDLVAKLRAGEPERVRPCTRCNQTCMVRDALQPNRHLHRRAVDRPRDGGSGLVSHGCNAAARRRDGQRPGRFGDGAVAAARGHAVTVVESGATTGGLAAVAGPNRPLVDWHVAELVGLGVEIRLGTTDVPVDADVVVQSTGSRAGTPTYTVGENVEIIDVAELRRGNAALPDDGVVAVLDPIGGPVAVTLAEELGPRAVLVTQDHIAGNELARTGDLAPANVRLAQRGVRIERRTTVDAVERHGDELAVVLRDRFTDRRHTLLAAAVVDCGFRLPTERRPGAHVVVGDAVAPPNGVRGRARGRRAGASI